MKAQRGEWDDEDEDDEVEASDDDDGASASASDGGEGDDGVDDAAPRLLGPEECAALTDAYLAGGRSYEARGVATGPRGAGCSSRRGGRRLRALAAAARRRHGAAPRPARRR